MDGVEECVSDVVAPMVALRNGGEECDQEILVLHERLRSKQYRHQPIRRVHILKEKGKRRPIGIAATEDKIVQAAVREVLEAIYEQDFLECSYPLPEIVSTGTLTLSQSRFDQLVR